MLNCAVFNGDDDGQAPGLARQMVATNALFVESGEALTGLFLGAVS